MSKALDPLRRLVVSFNARFASQLKALPSTTIPPAPPHVQVHLSAPAAAPFKPLPFFGQFQVKVAVPSHQDGPLLLAHLNHRLNTFARNAFVPEPARVAAVNFACKSAGRPHMASLLSKGSQRMLHHQPLTFAVPHGFARNVGLSSSRGFCSTVGGTMNGPIRMMAQMYAKPLGSLPAHAQKHQVSTDQHQPAVVAKKSHRKHKNHDKIKKRSPSTTVLSASVIRAFMHRASVVEQQHQMLALCNANAAVSTATAISLAKAAGKTQSELSQLPKLQSSDDCPTNVDMCFLLDASPLWHLDTMVSALHTDSLRAPKHLNSDFIENLLEITHYQYQHFLEVSSILQKLVQCPEAREISLDGYELRVQFVGTTLFEMVQFLKALGVDPKSPHFDLEEGYVDETMEQYFPQASVNDYYYAPSLTDDTWDDCSSLQSSLIMYAESDSSESRLSLAEMDPLPVQQSPWEGVAAAQDVEREQDVEEEEEEIVQEHESILDAEEQQEAMDLFPGEDLISPWAAGAHNPDVMSTILQASEDNLNKLSSQILNSAVVSEEYFDSIRGFLDSIEAVHKHSQKLYGSSSLL